MLFFHLSNEDSHTPAPDRVGKYQEVLCALVPPADTSINGHHYSSLSCSPCSPSSPPPTLNLSNPRRKHVPQQEWNRHTPGPPNFRLSRFSLRHLLCGEWRALSLGLTCMLCSSSGPHLVQPSLSPCCLLPRNGLRSSQAVRGFLFQPSLLRTGAHRKEEPPSLLPTVVQPKLKTGTWQCSRVPCCRLPAKILHSDKEGPWKVAAKVLMGEL